MIVEIVITAGIIAAAVFIMYKSIKKSSSGKCSDCEGHCGGCMLKQQKK